MSTTSPSVLASSLRASRRPRHDPSRRRAAAAAATTGDLAPRPDPFGMVDRSELARFRIALARQDARSRGYPNNTMLILTAPNGNTAEFMDTGNISADFIKLVVNEDVDRFKSILDLPVTTLIVTAAAAPAGSPTVMVRPACSNNGQGTTITFRYVLNNPGFVGEATNANWPSNPTMTPNWLAIRRHLCGIYSRMARNLRISVLGVSLKPFLRLVSGSLRVDLVPVLHLARQEVASGRVLTSEQEHEDVGDDETGSSDVDESVTALAEALPVTSVSGDEGTTVQAEPAHQTTNQTFGLHPAIFLRSQSAPILTPIALPVEDMSTVQPGHLLSFVPVAHQFGVDVDVFPTVTTPLSLALAPAPPLAVAGPSSALVPDLDSEALSPRRAQFEADFIDWEGGQGDDGDQEQVDVRHGVSSEAIAGGDVDVATVGLQVGTATVGSGDSETEAESVLASAMRQLSVEDTAATPPQGVRRKTHPQYGHQGTVRDVQHQPRVRGHSDQANVGQVDRR